MNSKSVVCRNLSVQKQKNKLLHDIVFSIETGTICGLLGPSGAGKTTLMRVVVGLQAPERGEIAVLGSHPGSKQNRHRVGYVTQSPSIYSDITVMQNLVYFARLIGVSKSTTRQTLEKVRMGSQAKQLAGTLSGGERTRVSLAIALLGDPELLVMDEPTVGLDPLLRRELWGLFKGMAGEGKTLLISSHAMDEASHCEQLLLLRDGELLWADSQTELLKTTGLQSVEEAFIKLVKGKV